jgi:transposase, IS5 family
MSFAQDGLNSKIKMHSASIKVRMDHPLIQLANAISWEQLAEIIIKDLKKTTAKGFWNIGRKLYLRVHLAIFILQARQKKTDAAIVQEIEENAVYQAFCGSTAIEKWKCPHANKIQEFRSRLSPETQMKLNEAIIMIAVEKGFADPQDMDIDSTVQEANISYPSDARMMLRFAEKCQRLIQAFKLDISFDLKKIRNLAQKYFFTPKNKSIEVKRAIFKEYYDGVRLMTLPVILWAEKRLKENTSSLKWNNRLRLNQVGGLGRKYFEDVGHFVKTNKIKVGKILSFHAQQVVCIRKGKVGKKNEFGRVFQLARIGGNFLFGLCTSETNQSDKHAVEPMLKKHAEIFGKGKLKSVGTDKGYYKQGNIKMTIAAGVVDIGIQEPVNLKRSINKTKPSIQEEIRCRRAGMEPLIGHAKRCGLGKSKMKSDEATHASGFRSLMSFNLNQLENYFKSEIHKKVC